MSSDFFDKLYELALLPNKDKATDLIFDHIDKLCWAEKWDEIDNILKNVDIDRLNTELWLSFLTITLCVCSKLSYRNEFGEKIKQRLLLAKNKEKTDRLLKGLKIDHETCS